MHFMLPYAALAAPADMRCDAALELDTETCQCLARRTAHISPETSSRCSDESGTHNMLLAMAAEQLLAWILDAQARGAWSKCYSHAGQH